MGNKEMHYSTSPVDTVVEVDLSNRVPSGQMAASESACSSTPSSTIGLGRWIPAGKTSS